MNEPRHLLTWDALPALRREALERERQMQRRAQRFGETQRPGPPAPPQGEQAPANGDPTAAGKAEDPPAQAKAADPPAGSLTPELQETLSQLLGALGKGPADPAPPTAPVQPEGSAPDSILSQLFSTPDPPPRAAGPQPPPAQRRGGISRLIRSLAGGETAALGENLKNTVASASRPLSDLLDSLSIDGETLLILLVMWVVFRERSDNKTLLLALGYLLL